MTLIPSESKWSVPVENATRIARGAERPPEGQVFWRSERNTPPNFVTLQRCSETMAIVLSLPVMQLLPALTWILQCAFFYDRKPHRQCQTSLDFSGIYYPPPQHQSSHSPISGSSNYLRGWFPKNKKDPAPPTGKANPLSIHRSQVQDHPPSPIDLWL